jgi:hypothetical protein
MNWKCIFRHKWGDWEYIRLTQKGKDALGNSIYIIPRFARHVCLRCGEIGFEWKNPPQIKETP